MKLFTGCLATETNTFSPMPTGETEYAERMLVRGGVPDDAGSMASALVVFRRRARERGWQVAEGLCATAEPGGLTTRRAYEGFRDELLGELRAAMPVDAVLLSLHGAMVAEGCDDCEGDLLARVRSIVGPNVPIGAELDPHCHLTGRMLDNADALVCYKEYPHVDIAERAEELFTIVADTLEGRVRPRMSLYDCRMISMYFTPLEPMRSYVDRLQALEGRDNVLSISVAHGFPWADVPELGTRLLVVTDDDATRGDALARELGRELIGLRGRTMGTYLGLEEGLQVAAEAREGPVVLADMGDNAGAGAASDNTTLLRALLARGITGAALGMLWDPIAVQMAMSAGEGAEIRLRLGGKVGPGSDAPLDETFTVTRVQPGLVQRYPGGARSVGDAVALHCRGVDVVVNSERTQLRSPQVFSDMGIDPAQRRVLVVKSINHFRAGFAPIARAIHYVDAGTALPFRFETLPYTRVQRPLWPLDAHPWED